MTGSTERITTDRAWRNRIVGQGAKPASQFVANARNWREHPRAQRAEAH